MGFFKKLKGMLSISAPKVQPSDARGRRAGRKAFQWNPGLMAGFLSKEKPMFQMKSGGVYAVAVRTRLDGKEEVTHFIRVDKDHRPRKVRKALRRAARQE